MNIPGRKDKLLIIMHCSQTQPLSFLLLGWACWCLVECMISLWQTLPLSRIESSFCLPVHKVRTCSSRNLLLDKQLAVLLELTDCVIATFCKAISVSKDSVVQFQKVPETPRMSIDTCLNELRQFDDHLWNYPVLNVSGGVMMPKPLLVNSCR